MLLQTVINQCNEKEQIISNLLEGFQKPGICFGAMLLSVSKCEHSQIPESTFCYVACGEVEGDSRQDAAADPTVGCLAHSEQRQLKTLTDVCGIGREEHGITDQD